MRLAVEGGAFYHPQRFCQRSCFEGVRFLESQLLPSQFWLFWCLVKKPESKERCQCSQEQAFSPASPSRLPKAIGGPRRPFRSAVLGGATAKHRGFGLGGAWPPVSDARALAPPFLPKQKHEPDHDLQVGNVEDA